MHDRRSATTALPLTGETRWGGVVVIADGGTLQIERYAQRVMTVTNVTKMTAEAGLGSDGTREILLRLRSPAGWRAFFIDESDCQSNLREIDPSVTTLAAAVAWLLPPGFVCRQGDVGIYPCAVMPTQARACAAGTHLEAFGPVLGRRHVFETAAHCDFFVADCRYFVSVRDHVRLIHPEHESIAIERGQYEIISARGTPIPDALPLREALPATLPL